MKNLRLVSRTKRLMRMIINTIYMIYCGKQKALLLNVSMEQIGNGVVHHNIGDDINYYLMKELSGKKIFNYVDVLNIFGLKNYMCIGSIIDWMTRADSCIWGSGVRDDSGKLRVQPHKVYAVRGPLTRQYLLDNGVDCPAIYGDPALLLPLISPPPYVICKSYKIGVILHKNDIGNIIMQKFVNTYKDVVQIDIMHYKDWRNVVSSIQKCEMIISSSLHGLIISDAYSIPNIWVKFSDETFDKSFKYLDYMKSVGRKEEAPLEINEEITFEEIYKLKESYIPIKFDIIPLLSVCPFFNNNKIGKIQNGK